MHISHLPHPLFKKSKLKIPVRKQGEWSSPFRKSGHLLPHFQHPSDSYTLRIHTPSDSNSKTMGKTRFLMGIGMNLPVAYLRFHTARPQLVQIGC